MPNQRLSPSELRTDAALPWDLFDANGHLLWGKGCLLERSEHMKSLIERGVYVRPDDFKNYHYPKPANAAPVAPVQAPPKETNPFRIRAGIENKLSLLLREAKPDAGFVGHVQELLPMIRELTEHNADAVLASIFLLEHAKYPVAHCVDVAILADMLSRRLDWSDAQRDSVLCAALTMNIAMIDAQAILAAQRMAPTPPQREMIASHPQHGVEMLRTAGVEDALWLEIVQDHHEVPGGFGYPNKKLELSQQTLLVRTLDMYCAITTPRADRKAADTSQAAKALLVQEGKVGNGLPGLMIKELGVFPIGSVVKLKNGDTAVVSRRPNGTTPMLVHSFLNSQGLPMLEPMWRDASKPEFAIVSGLARGSIKVPSDLEKIWSTSARK